jgi:hypothetical protein
MNYLNPFCHLHLLWELRTDGQKSSLIYFQVSTKNLRLIIPDGTQVQTGAIWEQLALLIHYQAVLVVQYLPLLRRLVQHQEGVGEVLPEVVVGVEAVGDGKSQIYIAKLLYNIV